MPLDAEGNYRSQIAAALAQMGYGGQDPSAMMAAGGMFGAPGNAQSPMLAQQMQRGPAAMPRGPMAMVQARK
jgi:hypothetical protein